MTSSKWLLATMAAQGGGRVAAVATLTVKPGQRDAAVAAFQPFLENARREAGTELYLLHAKDDTTLVIYEQYASAAAAAEHARNTRKVRGHASNQRKPLNQFIDPVVNRAFTGDLRQLTSENKALGAHITGPPKIERLVYLDGKSAAPPQSRPLSLCGLTC